MDDEDVIRLVLRKMLSRDGHEVKTASSGEQALTLLETEEFELLITDRHLPGLDGLELASKAKELQSIPVLMMTGSNNFPALPEQIDELRTKPITHEALREVVESLCPG